MAEVELAELEKKLAEIEIGRSRPRSNSSTLLAALTTGSGHATSQRSCGRTDSANTPSSSESVKCSAAASALVLVPIICSRRPAFAMSTLGNEWWDTVASTAAIDCCSCRRHERSRRCLFFQAAMRRESVTETLVDKVSPQQTKLPSQVQSRPDHPTHQPAMRPTNWQKDLPQDTDIMRIHRFLQAKNAEPRNSGGADRALAPARSLTKLAASPLHRPPVSMPTTTKRQRSPAKSSWYLRSLSRRALARTTPSVLAAPTQANPLAVSALRTVTSTANCAPWNRGSPLASTSMALSSAAGTATFKSRFSVASDQRARLKANAGQRSLWSDGPCAQPS